MWTLWCVTWVCVCAKYTHTTICMYSQCRPAPGIRSWEAGRETRHWSSCSADQSFCSSRGNCPTDCKGRPRKKNKQISYDERSGRIDKQINSYTNYRHNTDCLQLSSNCAWICNNRFIIQHGFWIIIHMTLWYGVTYMVFHTFHRQPPSGTWTV